jgi:hypothetical protein
MQSGAKPKSTAVDKLETATGSAKSQPFSDPSVLICCEPAFGPARDCGDSLLDSGASRRCERDRVNCHRNPSPVYSERAGLGSALNVCGVE